MDPMQQTFQTQRAAKEQLNQLIKSLPRDVRKEKSQQIKELQGNMSRSMRTLRDVDAGGLASSRASTAASSAGLISGRSTPSGRRPVQGPRQDGNQTARGGNQTARENAFQPPQRMQKSETSRSSQQSSPQFNTQFAPARTPPGTEMARPPQRWSPSPSDTSFDFTQRRPATARARSASADKYNPEGYRPASARSQSSRGDGSARGPGSAVSSSVYSGCSTPVAGRIWGHLPREIGNGMGKTHFPMKTHLYDGFVGDNDGPGLHGRTMDDDMQSGIERCIGHGRRYLGGTKCHLKGPLPQEECAQGLHGHFKGDDFQGGIERYVGCGLKKFGRSTHDRHHISDDVESEPGMHGHTKDHDFKDGMPYYIGKGKRRVVGNHGAETWRAQPKGSEAEGGYGHSHCAADFKTAGMSTRDIIISTMSRDPTRQGTHQDRRLGQPKTQRIDQAIQLQGLLPGS